ncbi:predicted protein [Sclerotinia sclerotiorum 1980 UF-70]|uniref:Uncharacterized protein n=1 Tax=Sclerotinia sclerotiorum (strain ATCC 18683 / 1980 / Ss-1) TaxID=665079 RepID=A7EUZ4_SCLS1|nr:predicted protein [Sclerotinia sclerotiorum 1980 UF-70]EDN93286.1 predicted protein [Sclerotinia sclerotiorum 1980 UF-70]
MVLSEAYWALESLVLLLGEEISREKTSGSLGYDFMNENRDNECGNLDETKDDDPKTPDYDDEDHEDIPRTSLRTKTLFPLFVKMPNALYASETIEVLMSIGHGLPSLRTK